MMSPVLAPPAPPENPPEHPRRLRHRGLAEDFLQNLLDERYLLNKLLSNSLASHPDGIAIAFLRAMAAICEVGIGGVWSPLNFLCACPLTSSSATSMLDIPVAFWAERADIGFLWVLLLDIDIFLASGTSNLDHVAVTACPAMPFVLVVHVFIAVPGPPLDFLPLLSSPLSCPSATCVRMVGGTLGAIARRIIVLRILVHQILEDQGSLARLPQATERKVPSAPAWFVATIESSCLRGVPLVCWALVATAVPVDNQSPRGASVAIT